VRLENDCWCQFDCQNTVISTAKSALWLELAVDPVTFAGKWPVA
jgi:hypothetical protein